MHDKRRDCSKDIGQHECPQLAPSQVGEGVNVAAPVRGRLQDLGQKRSFATGKQAVTRSHPGYEHETVSRESDIVSENVTMWRSVRCGGRSRP